MNQEVNIELISTFSCRRCQKAQEKVQEMIKELNNESVFYHEVNVINHIDYAVQLGVLRTPAIAINGKLVFTSLPSMAQFKKILARYIQAE